MALHDPSPKLTYEDYVLLPDDGKRHEIIDGEHFVTAAPFVRHQKIVIRLTLRLGGFIETHRLGHLLVAPTDVVLSPYDILQPDLLFISNERASILGEKNVQGERGGLDVDGGRVPARNRPQGRRGGCPDDGAPPGPGDLPGGDLRGLERFALRELLSTRPSEPGIDPIRPRSWTGERTLATESYRK
ncbi:MAG TPA: Uma2 family endonuclease [Thermoanaerobaculia bacterium]|jgi:hypothetical protein|nr:Uma2 family endonuclease [Thermoanaerobaculia bacterium]